MIFLLICCHWALRILLAFLNKRLSFHLGFKAFKDLANLLCSLINSTCIVPRVGCSLTLKMRQKIMWHYSAQWSKSIIRGWQNLFWFSEFYKLLSTFILSNNRKKYFLKFRPVLVPLRAPWKSLVLAILTEIGKFM